MFEVVGKLVNVAKNLFTGKWNVTFEIEGNPPEALNKIAQLGNVTIQVKKERKKRSLDANALLWVCLGQIAVAIGSDKWTVYLQMLKRYGKYTYICVKPSVVEAVKAQWRECEEIGEVNINGQQAIQMLCYFGSSTYDTKEFSVLLDGVISEMKEMGLQTPNTSEMRRALDLWEQMKNEKK